MQRSSPSKLVTAIATCVFSLPTCFSFLEVLRSLCSACHSAIGVAKTILIPYEALPSFGLSSTSSTTQTTKRSILSGVPLWVCWVIGTWSYWWLPSSPLKCLKSRRLKNFSCNWEVYQGPIFRGISETQWDTLIHSWWEKRTRHH